MPARVELPPDEVIDCWTLIREIGKAVVPDLNPNASGMECIIAKRPLPLGVIGVGNVQFVEERLTDDDRTYLRRVLPDLPALQVPYSNDVAQTFVGAFLALPDRPTWRPVLLTESRWLQESDRIIAAQWAVANQNLQVLQHWLDAGRIKAFRRKHVPVSELLVGTLIPRRDVLAYLDYCEIVYTGKEAAETSTMPEVKQGDDITASETETLEGKTVPAPKPVSRSARQVAAQPEVVKEEPDEPAVLQAQVIPAGPLLDIKEVSERTGISVSMLHEKMKLGSKYHDPTFPAKINFGERTVRYSQRDVDAWIQSRLALADK